MSKKKDEAAAPAELEKIDGAVVPAAGIKDYLGKKAKVKVEGATSAEVTLKGADNFGLLVDDIDGRARFYPWGQVREVFPS